MSRDEIPVCLRLRLRRYTLRRVAIGESRATVYELSAPGEKRMFLKSQRREPLFTLEGEAERLRWLQGRAPVPGLVDFVTDQTHDHLLMEALAGEDAATAKLSPEALVALLAEALRELHAVDITTCPFRHAADDLISRASALRAAGQVDEGNLDPKNLGRPLSEIFVEMLALRPASEDRVFTHGDFCLPNVIIHHGRLSGLIDLGSAGIGDRYRDLALIGRSLDRNHGPGWTDVFLARYGLAAPDPGKLRYYRLIDEFF